MSHCFQADGIQAGEQRSHIRSRQILGADNSDPIPRCDFVINPLRQGLLFLPGMFEEPERHAEISGRMGNLQFFVEKRKTILLQSGKIVKKRHLNAAASALCKTCMNDNPSRHVEYLTTNQRDSHVSRPRSGGSARRARRLAQASLQLFRIFQQLDYAFE
jgi:hypothetical protein